MQLVLPLSYARHYLVLTSCLAEMEGGCQEYPGDSIVASQPLHIDRILPPAASLKWKVGAWGIQGISLWTASP